MIRWTLAAVLDFEQAVDWLAERNPRAADVLIDGVTTKLEALRQFPLLGRDGRVAGTRELRVPPYIIVHRIRAGAVEVLRLMHTARTYLR